MKLLFIYTALVAFASSAIAQTTGEKTFRMRKPYWYQYVSAGDAFEVEWDVIDGGQMGAKVHLALYGGTATSVSFISTLATGIFNTGSYVWNVDTSSIPSKPVYAIRIMLDSDETVYDQSGIFFISASKSSSSLTATDSATYTTSPESTATGFESTTSGSESIVTDSDPSVTVSESTTTITIGTSVVTSVINTNITVPASGPVRGSPTQASSPSTTTHSNGAALGTAGPIGLLGGLVMAAIAL